MQGKTIAAVMTRTVSQIKKKRRNREGKGKRKKIVEKSMILEKNNLISDFILIT